MSRRTLLSWLELPLRAVRFLIFIAAAVLFMAAVVSLEAPGGFLGEMLLLVALFWFVSFTSIAVHEFGHYLAARQQGVWVLAVRVGELQGVARRQGWRWRWRWQRQLRIGGEVRFASRSGRRMRNTNLVIVAGGAVANLAVALLAAAGIWIAGDSVLAHVLVMVAAWNAAMGLTNLLPLTTPAATDGWMLLYWLRRPDERAPELAYARVLAQQLDGRAVSDLDDADIDAMAQQQQPMPLIALFYRVQQLQEAGDWNRVHELADALSRQVEALPPAARTALKEFLLLLQAEIAFAQSASAGDAALLPSSVPEHALWYHRALWPRCLALRAALDGDVAACEQHLGAAMAAAEDTVNSNGATGEAAVAEQVRRIARERAARHAESAMAQQGAAASVGA